MVNIKIGLATDSMNFTPTPVWQANNGYDYAFTNGAPFTEIIEDGTPTISEGYSYGSAPRTNTFKCSASGSMAQIKVLERYNHIAVYKDNLLVFCGYNPTFSKNIKKGVGSDGRKESYVEASISFDDYSSKLKDVQFSTDESFDLYYTASDSISVCDPSNPTKSLVHLLLGYLDPSHKYTYIFGTIPDILRTTKLSYFAVTWQDKVLNVLKDVLEQAGLAFYVSLMEIHIIDILETLTGTAVNIPNIEESAVRKGRSFIEVTIPEIRMATARVAQNMEVYDSGRMTVESKMWAWEDDVFYPKDAEYAEGSFTCERKDSKNPNGMDTDEKTKRFFNFQDYYFYGDKSLFTDNGAYLDYFSRTSTGLKYRIRNNSILNRTFQLTQRADVLLFRYADAYRPTDVWSGEKKDCDYIFSTEMAQRYANALISQKRTEATYYEFYADVVPSYPNGYPINTVVTLQGTDEENPLLLIVSKTDKFDQFGGYVYKAVPYNRSGVAVSPLYVASKETLPPPDNSFTASLSRDVIDCYSNRTPKDTTPVRLTVNIPNRLVTPVLTVAGTTTTMTREQVLVSGEYTDTDNWICDIDANLNGYDTCQLVLSVAGAEWTSTISKNVPTDNLPPEIIVPVGYTLVTQYCYGSHDAPEPRWVADASYDLEDAEDLVADIWWQDEIDGQCPLRPRYGYYIWMRQGIYDPDTETEPSTWTESLYDTPFYRFDFTASQYTYIKNDRSVQVNDNVIYFTPNLVGLNASALIMTASEGIGALPFDTENQRFVLMFSSNGAPSGRIKVEAILGTLNWSCYLTCDDQTEHNIYNGILATAPSDPLVGDSYVDSSADYKIKVYTENGWKLLYQSGLPLALLSEICGKAQKDVLGNIPTGTVEQSDYGYFNVIIAGLITAEYVKALKGVFEDIEVSGSISADHYFVHKGVFRRDRFYPEWF